MTKKEETQIKDIYDGNEIGIWGDGDTISFNLGMTTVGIPKEVWKDVKKDLKKLVKVI